MPRKVLYVEVGYLNLPEGGEVDLQAAEAAAFEERRIFVRNLVEMNGGNTIEQGQIIGGKARAAFAQLRARST
jgi:hypothetical protein